jgi:ADP-ribose pyrophosphatase YjhB (NUDIX family)
MATSLFSRWSLLLLLFFLVHLAFLMRSAAAFRPHILAAARPRRGAFGASSSPVKRPAVVTMASSSYSSTVSRHTPVPRAAVSVVVRHQNPGTTTSQEQPEPTFLLIERGNPPNVGVWCVPGGKIEMGEKTLEAAKRELEEEVKFCDENDQEVELAWYSEAFCTTDSIIEGDSETGKTGFHYVIAQCFAEVIVHEKKHADPPKVSPADDAKAAKWWTLQDIRKAEANKEAVPNLASVIERAEALYECGMLPTSHTMNIPNTPK